MIPSRSAWKSAPEISAPQRLDAGLVPETIEYARGRLADLYVPRESRSSVVLVHGGAFVFGSRRMRPMRYLAEQFLAANIAVCAIDYRLLFRGGGVDQAVEDTVLAFDAWRSRAPDPTRISLVGLSAGATTAMLAAAHVPIYRLACAFGVYERIGVRKLAMPDVATPTLLLHGGRDRLVSVEQTRRLAARREARALPTTVEIYEEARHGFFTYPGRARDAGTHALREHVQ